MWDFIIPPAYLRVRRLFFPINIALYCHMSSQKNIKNQKGGFRSEGVGTGRSQQRGDDSQSKSGGKEEAFLHTALHPWGRVCCFFASRQQVGQIV